MNPETMIQLLQDEIQEKTNQLAFAESEMRKAIIEAKSWERAAAESEQERAAANEELIRTKWELEDMERAHNTLINRALDAEAKVEQLKKERFNQAQTILTMEVELEETKKLLNEDIESPRASGSKDLRERLIISSLAGTATDCYFSATDKREALMKKAFELADAVMEKL